MTKEQFIEKYAWQPHEVYACFILGLSDIKPSNDAFNTLDDLEELYKAEEDFEKCADIVEVREKLKQKLKDVTENKRLV